MSDRHPYHYSSPHSERRITPEELDRRRRYDRATSADVRYLGDGPSWTDLHRGELYAVLMELARPRLADDAWASVWRVARDLGHVSGDTSFFLAASSAGAVLTWDRDVAQHFVGADGVLYIVSVRRNENDGFRAYVTVDTTWRDFV